MSLWAGVLALVGLESIFFIAAHMDWIYDQDSVDYTPASWQFMSSVAQYRDFLFSWEFFSPFSLYSKQAGGTQEAS